MDQDLTGRVAMVTGGASGIGAATVRLFASRGARVAIVDRDAEPAIALAEELRAEGKEALPIVADLVSEEAVENAVAQTIAQLGGLDFCFNNAGMTDGLSAFDELSLESWSKVIAVNLTSVFLCMKHQLRHMAQVGRGAIVNTSSGAGLTPAPLQPAYTASKHGVLGITKVAAKEYAARGIRVNAICPGMIETPMARLYAPAGSDMERIMMEAMAGGRFGAAEEVAEAVVWLCSDAASFISGDSIVVDGGTMCR